MSKYTTELRYICETLAGLEESKGYNDIDTIISKAIPKLFTFNFPIFDEAYRNVLCTKIVRRYYTREICEETYGLWKLRLQTRLTEIMPFYNQLYESEAIDFNPMYDTDLSTTHDGSATNESSYDDSLNTRNTMNIEDNIDISTGRDISSTDTQTDDTTNITTSITSTNNDETITKADTSTDLFSDTPQGAITNLENGTYLTKASKVTDSGTDTTNFDSEASNTTDSNYDNTTTKSSTVSDDGTRTQDRTGTQTSTGIGSKSAETTANSTEEYITHIIGKTGGTSYSKRLKEFRETFLNIDTEIINNLNDLFMGVW